MNNLQTDTIERLVRRVAQGLARRAPEIGVTDDQLERYYPLLRRQVSQAVETLPLRSRYGPHAAPALERVQQRARAGEVLNRAMALKVSDWEYIGPVLRHFGFYDPFGVGDQILDWDAEVFTPDELPHLLGVDVSAYDAAVIFHIAGMVEGYVMPRWTGVGLVREALFGAAEPTPGLAVRVVPLETATDFIATHHSTLPAANLRGLMFSLGALWQGELVAVATAGTPTGRWAGRVGCPTSGILEITRVASVGAVYTSSRRTGRRVPVSAPSKLVAHILDLLPRSGRDAEGCLLVTYSLLSEAHTTYLAVADKGLRPVALVRPRGPGGQRTKRGSLKSSPKIRWEAGPAAMDPDWSLLLSKGESVTSPPKRLAGPMRAFARYATRIEHDGQ